MTLSKYTEITEEGTFFNTAAMKDIHGFIKDRRELIEALEKLLNWITRGDRTGNPYCKSEIREAIQALRKAKGFKEDLKSLDY